jgi:hypothetical protein
MWPPTTIPPPPAPAYPSFATSSSLISSFE